MPNDVARLAMLLHFGAVRCVTRLINPKHCWGHPLEVRLCGPPSRFNAKAADPGNAMWGSLGQVGGAMIVSDITKKQDIDPVDPAQALASVGDRPVSNWAYK